LNYYQRHLGDYAKDTKHLSMAEHGAFTLLLDYYYATEKPIPDDRCERIANAYAESERIIVRSVLGEFFFLTPEGWRNGKADTVIAASRAKSLKAKESAETRWHREESERNANASEAQCERNAIHKPLTKNHKETKAPAPAAPLPSWLPPSAWADFLAHRKAIKKPMGEGAIARMLKSLETMQASGVDVLARMDESIRNGWADVYPPKGPLAASPTNTLPAGGRRRLG
jgi:uncharacterized protein YdaU (DUF1376 family)